MTQRRTIGHRSPEQTAFYPQFAPRREAPYIYSVSMPTLPAAQKAYLGMLAQQKVEGVERIEKRQTHCQNALEEREQLEKTWKVQRQQSTQIMKQETLEAAQRKRNDRAQREERWTKKTATSPFGVDQWQEDVQLYDQNQAGNKKSRERQRLAAREVMQDQTKRRKAKIGEVDVLDNLRRERKKLQEDQKELKARLDLDKVDKRCEAAQGKADAEKEAHLQRLADKGQMDMMSSDAFLVERLNPEERLARKMGKGKLVRSDSWRPQLFGQSTINFSAGDQKAPEFERIEQADFTAESSMELAERVSTRSLAEPDTEEEKQDYEE